MDGMSMVLDHYFSASPPGRLLRRSARFCWLHLGFVQQNARVNTKRGGQVHHHGHGHLGPGAFDFLDIPLSFATPSSWPWGARTRAGAGARCDSFLRDRHGATWWWEVTGAGAVVG
jgi:hypothetical protein